MSLWFQACDHASLCASTLPCVSHSGLYCYHCPVNAPVLHAWLNGVLNVCASVGGGSRDATLAHAFL